MSSALSSIISVYDVALQPIESLARFGFTVSPIDLAGALRLALVLRQLREAFHGEHVNRLKARSTGGSSGRSGKEQQQQQVESRARTRDLATTLVMVYGGEAVVAPWLGIQPSFILGGTIPATFLASHYLIDALPSVPVLSLYNELPLAIVDAFTRALLLCNFVPAVVTSHPSPLVSSSPWTLCLTALFMANGGPFFTNALSLLQPYPVTLTTPPELLPWGWTATDLWVAPLITALYATLTHAQPFFANLHSLLFSFFSPLGLAPLSFRSLGMGEPKGSSVGVLQPVDADEARAVCVVVMGALFVTRAVRTFGFVSQAQNAARKETKDPVGVEKANEVAEQELIRDVTSLRKAAKKGPNGGKKTKTQ